MASNIWNLLLTKVKVNQYHQPDDLKDEGVVSRLISRMVFFFFFF